MADKTQDAGLNTIADRLANHAITKYYIDQKSGMDQVSDRTQDIKSIHTSSSSNLEISWTKLYTFSYILDNFLW